MEKLITGPLAEALARNRERFNRLYAQAAQRSPQLDPDILAQLLQGPLQQCVDAVEAVAPELAERAASMLFETCLVLFSQGYLGQQSRNPLVPALWQQLLPKAPLLLARSPRSLAASLSNAAVNIWQEDQAAGQRWLKRLQDLLPFCETAEQALDVGLVLAWRSGMAHYRETALQYWLQLPEQLQLACLGISEQDGVAAAVAATAIHRRWQPPHLAGKQVATKLQIVGKVGSFKGVGGQFTEPPLVAGNGVTLIAYDGEGTHTVWADFYGITLKRTQEGPEGLGSGKGAFSIDAEGMVTFGALQTLFPPLAKSTSSAATDDTLAVTLPHSHAVYLVAPLVLETAV